MSRIVIKILLQSGWRFTLLPHLFGECAKLNIFINTFQAPVAAATGAVQLSGAANMQRSNKHRQIGRGERYTRALLEPNTKINSV